MFRLSPSPSTVPSGRNAWTPSGAAQARRCMVTQNVSNTTRRSGSNGLFPYFMVLGVLVQERLIDQAGSNVLEGKPGRFFSAKTQTERAN